MKKIIVILTLLLSIFNTSVVYAEETEEGINTEGIIDEQEESLGISGFIKEAQKYTDDVFEDTNIADVYKSAISGDVEITGIVR